MTNDDSCVPKVVTDFVFDLYDSVTLSQLPEEQTQLYVTDFAELNSKYFSSTPWPSPAAMASECNGNPLFLALYREMTHRQWHAVSRPSIRDRLEGWSVYKELFEEVLEADSFFLLPSWCFDILNEFVYQFQGFCQVQSAVYASARKHGLLEGTPSPSASQNLMENFKMLQNTDAWDVETVYGYLHRLVNLEHKAPVYHYLSLFASVTLSRLECLLGDYTSSLKALGMIIKNENTPTDAENTWGSCLQSVFTARLSLAYHAGVSFLMLRRYKDAMKTLGDICAFMQRGFKTGQLRRLEQYNKQYDRMLALLAILQHICPAPVLEDAVARAVREKYGTKLESSRLEDFFMAPKFISLDTSLSAQQHQLSIFVSEMKPQPAGRNLRSFLKLYTRLPVQKLANFHDMSVDEFLPLLLSYKSRMRQKELPDGEYKMALDIHYYLVGDEVHVDEAEKQRRFENYFIGQIAQNGDIRKDAVAIDTKV